MASDPGADADDVIECEGHGAQPVTLVCEHLAQSQPDDEKKIGFHWNADDGMLVANCDACEAEADDDGFLPDDYVEETFVLICRECFAEIAAVNGVERFQIEAAEAASK